VELAVEVQRLDGVVGGDEVVGLGLERGAQRHTDGVAGGVAALGVEPPSEGHADLKLV
jgi:hypothetical protein